MKTKFFTLIALVGFAGACIAQAQSPTPTASPKVKRARTKTAAAARFALGETAGDAAGDTVACAFVTARCFAGVGDLVGDSPEVGD